MYEVSDYAYSLHIVMSRSDVFDMLMLMNRATNTLEPKEWPSWAAEFITRLEEFSHAKTYTSIVGGRVLTKTNPDDAS